MTSDSLLTELERQKKYLSDLPTDFKFPLFNAMQALESQRRSAYRNTAAAGREIVDNAIEAGATSVHVVFETPSKAKRAKHQRSNQVTSVAYIDNGSGMLPTMARYALTWGGGTHFKEPRFIGKFGFGLPNASINQARRTEVYTKTEAGQRFTCATLDIDKFVEHGLQSIPEPEEAELPAYVTRYAKEAGLTLEHGTVVVWKNIDRLTYSTAARLTEHLLDDFGVTYRYLLGTRLGITVGGREVRRTDPLFLDTEGMYFVPEEEGGAQLVEERTFPVRYYRDGSTGELRLDKIDSVSESDAGEASVLATGTIVFRAARFPKGFAVGTKGAKGDPKRRFEIRKPRRGISFVRANREIETVDAFPKTEKDRANLLGDWPLLQSYAYHWGVEVRFEPSLDEVFGMANDKQTVRPSEVLWKLFAKEELDALLRRENAEQRTLRRFKPKAERSPTPTEAENAARDADAATGRPRKIPDDKKAAAKEGLADKVRQKVEEGGDHRRDADQFDLIKAIDAEAERRPYLIDYEDDERGAFYTPHWVGTQVVVRINRRHPFFEVLYGSILDLDGGSLAKEAIDVLLLTLARAELQVEGVTSELYRVQREDVWSPYLQVAMRSLDRGHSPGEEEDDSGADAA